MTQQYKEQMALNFTKAILRTYFNCPNGFSDEYFKSYRGKAMINIALQFIDNWESLGPPESRLGVNK